MVQYGGLMEGRSSRGALFYVVRLRVMVQYGVLLKGGCKVFPWGVKELRSVFFILRQVGVVLHSFILRQVGIVLHFFWVTMGVW